VVCLAAAACGRKVNANDEGRQAAPAAASAPAPALAPAAPHGAVAASESRLRRAAACSLISAAEMAGILGAPIGKAIEENSAEKTSCAYPPADAGSRAQAEVEIEWNHGAAASFGQQMLDAFGGSAVGREVAHSVALGDSAVYSREGALTIRSGTALIAITLPMRPDSEAQATAIGTMLMGRLVGSAAAAPAAGDAPAKAPDGGTDTTPKPTSLPLPEGFQPDANCPDPRPTGDAELATAAAATIPLVEGLTLAHTWTNQLERYDHECLSQISRINSLAVVVTGSCPMGEDRHLQKETRSVCIADLRDAYMYETAGHPEFPETLRGALKFSLSVKSFSELNASGHTRHRFLEFGFLGGRGEPKLVEDDDGQIERKGKGTFRVIVNDHAVDLPVIEAAGTFPRRGTNDEFTLAVLDDARFPLVLDYHHRDSKFFVTYTKITFPTSGEVEKHLANDRHVDVYGIYFDFASDRLRSESEPVLREISEALRKNPEWKLTINGHTDNVGGDAFNLDLSKRRSAAVRSALSQTYHIDPARLSTAGFGASQPKESNGTVEGRSKNRRVELVRE
jgi:hypothetical protein